MPMLNLPNFLTLIRIAAIPCFLVLLSSRLYIEALAVFIVGGLTDALDGVVARRMHQTTSLGAHLDPAADKLLLVSSFVMLGVVEAVPLWLVVLVVSRDLIILLGYGLIYFLVEERLEIQPTIVGKLSTLIQLVTVGVVLLVLYPPVDVNPWLVNSLYILTAATTVVSGLQYLYRGLLWLQNKFAV
jgi:cardiolipin synthase